MSINNKEKRKKKKKKRLLHAKIAASKKSSSSGLGPVFTEIQNPLSNITEEEREKIIDSISLDSKKSFDESFQKLQKIIKAYDPISIISIISGYTLTIGVSDQGIKRKEKADSTRQFHVEILQALILQINEEELGEESPHPKIIQDVIEELKILGRTSNLSRFNSEILKLNEEEKAIQEIQSNTRSYTQAVRNWGYFSQGNL